MCRRIILTIVFFILSVVAPLGLCLGQDPVSSDETGVKGPPPGDPLLEEDPIESLVEAMEGLAEKLEKLDNTVQMNGEKLEKLETAVTDHEVQLLDIKSRLSTLEKMPAATSTVPPVLTELPPTPVGGWRLRIIVPSQTEPGYYYVLRQGGWIYKVKEGQYCNTDTGEKWRLSP